MTKSDSLTLYILPGCPYCKKVISFLEQHNISMNMKDVSDPDIKTELVHLGGKGQVPCLIHDGKALYESDEIITWIDSNHLKHSQDNPPQS